jgi:TolA-binding protein
MLVGALGLAVPAFAQSTGMVKGKVVDAQKQPVDGAKVVIEFQEGVNRKFEVKSNKKGEFIQIGLPPGRYKVTATKEGVGTASDERKVSIGATEQIDLTLAAAGAGGGGPLSKEDEAFKKAFTEGVEASKKGDHDGAIAKFTEGLKLRPDCYACQYNIGGALMNKQQYDQAELAFLAASKLDPSSAEPYNALANMYNSQKKFDKAAEMTAEAMKRGGATAGGANPEVLFNQGVTLWNAGKIPEAKAQFEAAVKAKPDYADAQYWLGMASLNGGDMKEAATAFEKYLQMAPTGQYAEQVKKILSQIKQ